MADVSVVYTRPVERIPTLKEHILRRMVGHRIESYEFRALSNINLELRRGEALGVIGRNGAGKSTLLKVAARVLYPTTGRLQLFGRVLPILELGMGFNKDLTGRQNVFLYGALLKLSRATIREKFDEIVDFSELAPFIDSPLRTYSSGMTMRLAFAIASSVQPDILLVDEVLAVGDLAFEEKCKARVEEFRRAGCAIMLVSHGLDTVREVCTRAIWVDDGRIRLDGNPEDVISAYQDDVMPGASSRH